LGHLNFDPPVSNDKISQYIKEGFEAEMKKRIDIINDPKDLIEDFELENFSILNLESDFKKLLGKLQFTMPQRLYVPVTNFVMANLAASNIQITDKNLVFEFDPRKLGFISNRVSEFLSDISHPSRELGESHSYSLTLDQNLLNALFMEMGTTKQQLSIRYLASLFDKQLQWIKMMSTSLLQINMPNLVNEHGASRQFDIVSTIDQETFMRRKKGSHVSGFNIDEHGRVKGTLNFVSYMKLGPKSLIVQDFRKDGKVRKQKPKTRKQLEEEEEIEVDEDDDEEVMKNRAFYFHKMTRTKDWEVVRTIYSSLALTGQIDLKRVSPTQSELSVKIDNFEISKLDFHKGHPDGQMEASAPSAGHDSDEDFDDEDDEEVSAGSADDRTPEGGIIQALLNLQIKPRIKEFLPSFRHSFSNDLQLHEWTECYGIHLGIPELDYFKGGFLLKGDFDKVAVNDDACLEVETNTLEMITHAIAPDIVRTKIQQLDFLYDHVESMNPTLAGYMIKPTDMINTAATQGFGALVDQISDKVDNFMGNVQTTDILSTVASAAAKGFQYEGGKEGGIDSEKWGSAFEEGKKGIKGSKMENSDWQYTMNTLIKEGLPEIGNIVQKVAGNFADSNNWKTSSENPNDAVKNAQKRVDEQIIDL